MMESKETNQKSLFQEYLQNVIRLLQRISDEEESSVNEAAKTIADAVEFGHNIFAFGCTHSSLPIQDLVYRAGGFMLINPIFGPGIAALDTRPATMTSEIENLPGYAKIIFDAHPINEGDVLILVSVSGRNSVPVELAQIAKQRKVKIIGVISRDYSENVTSRHSSGKKMYEFADVILDNKVAKGDALLHAEGVPQKFCPASGVTSNALLHAMIAATIQELLRRGITPPIYLAGNVDGGKEYNAKLLEQYKDHVFYM
ncbi:MAG TPA: SIS domain-containing protein [Anaerolineaceae bacterium]|nr:SIS domain-containing protein [Anaerolineaceae bacterium]